METWFELTEPNPTGNSFLVVENNMAAAVTGGASAPPPTCLVSAASTAGDVTPARPVNSGIAGRIAALACVAWNARSAMAGFWTPAGGSGVGWLDCAKSRGCIAFSTLMA